MRRTLVAISGCEERNYMSDAKIDMLQIDHGLSEIQVIIYEIADGIYMQNAIRSRQLKSQILNIGCVRSALETMVEKFTSTNNARDAICPHWETYNRGGSGEFGACNCGGKISSGQTSPVA